MFEIRFLAFSNQRSMCANMCYAAKGLRAGGVWTMALAGVAVGQHVLCNPFPNFTVREHLLLCLAFSLIGPCVHCLSTSVNMLLCFIDAYSNNLRFVNTSSASNSCIERASTLRVKSLAVRN